MSLSHTYETHPNASKTSLLSSEETEHEKYSPRYHIECTCHKRKPLFRRIVPVLLAHLGFTCLYALISILLIKALRPSALNVPPCIHNHGGNGGNEAVVHSPAHVAAVYSPRIITGNVGLEGPYVGNPNSDTDKAWRELLSRSNIRISQETLRKINRTSIELADGSGDHWGSLGVYHHLHCLKTLRHYIARDQYGKEMFQNYTIPEGHYYPDHIEHCVEALRNYLMCQPDLSLVTYDWVDYLTEPEPNLNIRHECVDWERLEGWADMHAFSMWDERGLVRRPNGTIWPQHS